MEPTIQPLDTAKETSYIPSLDDLIFSDQDRVYLDAAVARRLRQNARRLKNWTGARHVEAKTAD